ncbi:MAG: hypothetical protein CMK07_15510 [Ponticaulis sp.]|nr:hypothetical protein [Ponticaulis sp.]
MLKSNNQYGLSSLRLIVMRIPYALTGILFGLTVWPTLFQFRGEFEPTEGVAYAFWGALTLLALIGLRFPVKMLPILLIQFLYKLIWILAVGLPHLNKETMSAEMLELLQANAIGVAIDAIAIPWLFVARNYIGQMFTRSSEK